MSVNTILTIIALGLTGISLVCFLLKSQISNKISYVSLFLAIVLLAINPMINSTQHQAPAAAFRARQSFCKANTPGCSQFDQAGILNQIFTQIGTTNKYFVEFGARRPQILNSSYFRMKKGWKGLLMDGDPEGNAPNCGGIQPAAEKLLNEPLGAPVILRKEFITKENINQIFEKYKVPKSFDLLTIDVDKNDYHLMDALNTKSFSPRVVAIEFSAYFNSDENCIPPYKPDNVWDGKSVTNSSLAALNILMNSKGYSYITHASGEHAIFVRNTELSPIDVNKSIPHTIKVGWQNEVRENPKLKHKYNPDHFICK